MASTFVYLPTQRGCHTDLRSFLEGLIGLARRRNMNVRLNEAKVTLNYRANVLHPLDGALLMGRNRASSESIALSVH